MAALNIVVLGITGILSLPAITSFFAAPVPDQILINIGVGATNSLSPNGNPGGNCPSVALYDVNGNQLGFADCSDSSITDGGSQQLSISGAEGSSASETPEYIQLYATGDNAVCIAWFTTTSSASDGGDFRSWNGATAQFCGLPWYPSTAQFPGVATPYQPPCFWMSSDGRFVDGFSARLTDFFFPGSSGSQANETAVQWANNPNTLCHAPARQQFYNSTGTCIPFYPSGLDVVNQKDSNGFDVDFIAIESSFTMTCSDAGIPFNNVDLAQETVIQPDTSVQPDITIPAGVTLQSSLNLGPLRRSVPTTSAPNTPQTITASPLLPVPPKREHREPILNRRVEKRAEQPHAWCEENQLVISSYSGHSAIEVCESASSWGPDFVSLAEDIFCDMCTRQAYHLCGGNGDSATMTASSGQAVVTGTWSNVSQALNTIGTCFDLGEKQLMASARLRRDRSVPVKSYSGVRHWN